MRYYITKLVFVGIMGLFIGLYIPENKPKANTLNTMEQKDWIWPADGIVSDTFGTRHGKHKGIDIAGKVNSPIFAADDGVVEKSYYSNSYGNVIFIHHPNHLVTIYAHLNTRNVLEGQSVKQGQVIGKMGRSGQATGVHLHFETHQSEWTYEKKFAFNPESLLGIKKLGDVVQAGIMNPDDKALEASLRFRYQGDTKQNIPSSSKDIRNQKKYVVQKGDTLLLISREKNLSVKELKVKNHLSSDLIIPGQILIVK